jgi:hypothetical protein
MRSIFRKPKTVAEQNGKIIPVLKGETVCIPFWYWIKIAEYAVEVEKAKEMYEAWQTIYIKDKNR